MSIADPDSTPNGNGATKLPTSNPAKADAHASQTFCGRDAGRRKRGRTAAAKIMRPKMPALTSIQ